MISGKGQLRRKTFDIPPVPIYRERGLRKRHVSPVTRGFDEGSGNVWTLAPLEQGGTPLA